MNDLDLVVYQISRARVEVGDCRTLADQFDAGKMDVAQLRACFGRMAWCVNGYDDNPAALYSIPEVRRFFREWHHLRPEWLFFGSLAMDNLKVMYASLLNNAVSVDHDVNGSSQVLYDRCELGRLLADDLEIADGICVRARISPALRMRRANEVVAYFGF
jgi:hypothetical protein